MQSVGATSQTYIVAQNPLVLAHLLRENQSRPLDPQAYTTPASVFNTLAVDFAEKIPEDDPKYVEKILNPDPATTSKISLQTCPIQMKELKKLDPIVDSDTNTLPTSPNPSDSSSSIPQVDIPSIQTVMFPADPNNSVSSTSSGTLSRDTMAFSIEKDEILKVIIGHKEDVGNLSQNITPQIQMTASLSSCSDFSIGNFSQISSLPTDSRRSSVNLDQSVASNNSAGVYSTKQNMNQPINQIVQSNALSDGALTDSAERSSTDSPSQNSSQSINPSSPRNMSNNSNMDSYSNRVRSLERNTHIHSFAVAQNSSVESYGKRIGSLERNSKIVPGCYDSLGRKLSYSNTQKPSQSHTGSLQKQYSVPVQSSIFQSNVNQYVPPSNPIHPAPLSQREMQHSMSGISGQIGVNPHQPIHMKQQMNLAQYVGQSNLNASLAASVANAQKNRQAEPPLVEEIYDFGGENVKSCAYIAANKAGLNRSNQSGYFCQSSPIAFQPRSTAHPALYRPVVAPNQPSPPPIVSNSQGSPRLVQPYMGIQGHLSRISHIQPQAPLNLKANTHTIDSSLDKTTFKVMKSITSSVQQVASYQQAASNIQHVNPNQQAMSYTHSPTPQTAGGMVKKAIASLQDGSPLDTIKPCDVPHSGSNISLGAQVLNMATPAPPSMAYQQRCLEVTANQQRILHKTGNIMSSSQPDDSADMLQKEKSIDEVIIDVA